MASADSCTNRFRMICYLSLNPDSNHMPDVTLRTLISAFILLICSAASADSPATVLELPAKAIFAKGPNTWNGDVLEITRGRGATIGWYVQAGQAEDVDVFIEYSCEKEL